MGDKFQFLQEAKKQESNISLHWQFKSSQSANVKSEGQATQFAVKCLPEPEVFL